MRVATWNVNWAPPGSGRGDHVAVKLRGLGADIMIVTEGFAELLPPDGHLIDAGDDWGYALRPGRRKTLAWSRHPWRDVRRLDEGPGKGRVVAGITETDAGPVGVIAVCIPWRDAHVRTGLRRNALQWQEHQACCTQLLELRQDFAHGRPTLIAGDFNQRIPRRGQPLRVEASLSAALTGMTTWTAGDSAFGQLIDHVAGSAELAAEDVVVWPGEEEHGRLSDHSGVACTVSVVSPGVA